MLCVRNCIKNTSCSFYIARYEKEITSQKNIDLVAGDLEYFRDEMVQLYKRGELSDDEIVDLMGFVNTIITHITNGNGSEERLVSIMGGTVIETESEKLIRKGKEDEAKKYGSLILHLTEEGKSDLIVKIADDDALREKLYKEYQL